MAQLATVQTTAPLSADDARALTDRIRQSVESLWSLLLEAHERKAWRALGYGSWREYATAEFGMSQRRAYYLLSAARVEQALAEASGVCTSVQISEAEARDLKPILPEVTDEIRARVEAGDDPAEAVREVVEQKRRGSAVEPDDTEAQFAQDLVGGIESVAGTGIVRDPHEPAPALPKLKRVDTHRLTALVTYVIDAAHAAENATDEQIDALVANDLMLAGLRKARTLIDRIIRQHSTDAKSASA